MFACVPRRRVPGAAAGSTWFPLYDPLGSGICTLRPWIKSRQSCLCSTDRWDQQPNLLPSRTLTLRSTILEVKLQVGWFFGGGFWCVCWCVISLKNRMTCPANSRLFSVRQPIWDTNIDSGSYVANAGFFTFCGFVSFLYVVCYHHFFCNKGQENLKVFKDLWDEDFCFFVVSQVTSWWFGNSILPAVPCSYHNLAYIFVYLV